MGRVPSCKPPYNHPSHPEHGEEEVGEKEGDDEGSEEEEKENQEQEGKEKVINRNFKRKELKQTQGPENETTLGPSKHRIPFTNSLHKENKSKEEVRRSAAKCRDTSHLKQLESFGNCEIEQKKGRESGSRRLATGVSFTDRLLSIHDSFAS